MIRKLFKQKTIRIFFISIIVLVSIMMIFLIMRSINLAIRGEIIIITSPSVEKIYRTFGESVPLVFETNIITGSLCSATCTHQLIDQSTKEILVNESFVVDAEKKLRIEKNPLLQLRGYGQTIYQYHINCQKIPTKLCPASTDTYAQTSTILVAYEPTTHQKEIMSIVQENYPLLISNHYATTETYALLQEVYDLNPSVFKNGIEELKHIEEETTQEDAHITQTKQAWNNLLFETLEKESLDYPPEKSSALLLRVQSITNQTRLFIEEYNTVLQAQEALRQQGEALRIPYTILPLANLDSTYRTIQNLTTELNTHTLFIYPEHTNAIDSTISLLQQNITKQLLETEQAYLLHVQKTRGDLVTLAIVSAIIDQNNNSTDAVNNKESNSKKENNTRKDNNTTNSLNNDNTPFLLDPPTQSNLQDANAAMQLRCTIVNSINHSYQTIRTNGLQARMLMNETEKVQSTYEELAREQEIIQSLQIQATINHTIDPFIAETVANYSAQITMQLAAINTVRNTHKKDNASTTSSDLWTMDLFNDDMERIRNTCIKPAYISLDALAVSNISLIDNNKIIAIETIAKNEAAQASLDITHTCCIQGVCKPCSTTPSPHPLLLIHGHSFSVKTSAFSSPQIFNTLEDELVKKGEYVSLGTPDSSAYGITAFGFDTPIVIKPTYYVQSYSSALGIITEDAKTGNIDTYTIRLRDIIEGTKKATGATQVDIIAHSMGGLVVRRYLQIFGNESVHTFIMIGTPNNGIDDKTYILCKLYGETNECEDMKQGSVFLKQLNTYLNLANNTVIIGGSGCSMSNDFDGDGVVALQNVKISGVPLITINGTCEGTNFLHNKLLSEPEYSDEIIRATISTLHETNETK